MKTGLVLSGGGSRAAYQVGALRALEDYLRKISPDPHTQPFNIIIGSSIGAINGLITAACIKDGLPTALNELEELWRERQFRNTFAGTPTQAFFRAIRMTLMQYLSPGPKATKTAIFDPSPLMNKLDSVLGKYGGLSNETRDKNLDAVGVMTTVEGHAKEGKQRKPLLFLCSREAPSPELLEGASFDIALRTSLSAKHGFASAALPSVLPPVMLDTEAGEVSLVDGGISQNVPVDPAVRLGAERVIIIDISGRDWWLKRYGEEPDKRPDWEVPAANKTFCIRPPETLVLRSNAPLGPILQATVGNSKKKFIEALGPVWPVFTLMRKKLGEDVAYEAMSYVALDKDYIAALIDQGYRETKQVLERLAKFDRPSSYEALLDKVK